MKREPRCRWTQDDNGVWETKCGNLFEVTEGTPYENDMKFCPYCGKPLVEYYQEPNQDKEGRDD